MLSANPGKPIAKAAAEKTYAVLLINFIVYYEHHKVKRLAAHKISQGLSLFLCYTIIKYQTGGGVNHGKGLDFQGNMGR